jgi:hypothetical protein
MDISRARVPAHPAAKALAKGEDKGTFKGVNIIDCKYLRLNCCRRSVRWKPTGARRSAFRLSTWAGWGVAARRGSLRVLLRQDIPVNGRGCFGVFRGRLAP